MDGNTWARMERDTVMLIVITIIVVYIIILIALPSDKSPLVRVDRTEIEDKEIHHESD